MAKSLRSKWRRKMKQVKRVRYGQKELEQLKSVLEKAKENDAQIASEVTMADADVNKLYTVVTRPTRRSRAGREDSEDPPEVTEESMDTTGDKKIRIFDPSTMKDQHGQYPAWMSSHRLKKIKKNSKKAAKQKKKVEKKKNKARKNY
uniref:Protein LLP n=1 Tax=Lygus hesperus TaxID=30085 RepID=A0A146M1S0_LYGHE